MPTFERGMMMPSQGRDDVLRDSSITALTINNLSISVTKTPLLNLMAFTGFAGKYDYVYVPCNQDSGTSRGHAFVNFQSNKDAEEFFKVWHGSRVNGAVVTVAVSIVQGFETVASRWTSRRLKMVQNPEFRPFIQGKK
jgi:hypothetical protein